MQHTNEELAALIQDGKTEYIPQLWEQVQDFVKHMANKHLLKYPQHFQQLHDDMVNQAYFSFLDAVRLYQVGKRTFVSYLAYHIRNAFNEVLQGRTSRQQNEPLNAAVSVDLSVGDTEDLTLADMLIDTTSEDYYRRIEDRDLWRSVHRLLQDGIDTLPETYREMFQIMLERGTSTADTLRIMGVMEEERHKYYENRRKGLRNLKRYITIRLSHEKGKDIALEEFISYHTSAARWRHHLFTSTVEQAVMARNDRKDTLRIIGNVLYLQP